MPDEAILAYLPVRDEEREGMLRASALLRVALLTGDALKLDESEPIPYEAEEFLRQCSVAAAELARSAAVR